MTVVRSTANDVDGSITRGASFLIQRQSPDGAWRSEIYGHFRHGDALTPLVVAVLQACPETEETNRAIDRGMEFLLRLRPETTELAYPVYSASFIVRALSDPRQAKHVGAREAWLHLLLQHQLTEERGWHESDLRFGGWGYAGVIPRKPKDGPIPEAFDANLSATVEALEALRIAAPGEEAVFAKARIFLQRCQNWPDDGGFTFVPDDPFRNKAGRLASDPRRFVSYGSATCDGLRALRACSATAADKRFAAGWRWLESNLNLESFGHPGDYPHDRSADRDAVVYYFSASLSQLLHDGDPHGWRALFLRALATRQRADGSWRNELNQVREDDPLVATALALRAIAANQLLRLEGRK